MRAGRQQAGIPEARGRPDQASSTFATRRSSPTTQLDLETYRAQSHAPIRAQGYLLIPQASNDSLSPQPSCKPLHASTSATAPASALPPLSTRDSTSSAPHTDSPAYELSISSKITMSGKKPGAYGANHASDTSFRKTWDRDEYAAKARQHDEKQKEEGRARYEAKLQGKKYVRRASTPPDAKETEARKSRLDVGAMVGKTMLVPAGAATGKRGRGAGFYCDACDLTFKDNLQLVEHLNSKQHLVATGESGEVKKATVEEVRERLAWLNRKREDEKNDEVVDLGARLEQAREKEQREREEKRRKRNEKRRKTAGGVGVKTEYDPSEGVIA